jgi:16S rRNA processing protein RimM
MIGYEIIDAVLGTIGTVEEIRSIGPVESIITTHNGKSLNIPMVDRFITKVDDDNNQVLVSIPESFIE